MILLTALFIFYYSLLMAVGSFVYKFHTYESKSTEKSKLFGIEVSTFYPIVALFFIGNLLIILNFFIGLKYARFLIIFILLFFSKGIFKELMNLFGSNFQKNKIHLILFPAIASFFLVDLGFNYDAGLYNLKYQKYIYNQKILINATLFDPSLGLTQVGDYLSSLHFIKSNYLYMYFPNLVFVVVFFNFLQQNLQKNNKIYKTGFIFIILFGILDNFGYLGGRNGFIYFENLGKQDITFSILFFITSFLIFYLYEEDKIEKPELLLIFLITIFTIQYRLIGYLNLIFFVLLLFIKKYKLIKKEFYFGSSILGFWLLRNLLLTKCLIYPVSFTCFNDSKVSYYFSQHIRTYNRAYNFGDNLIDWFKNWYEIEIYRNILINFVISIFLLLIIKYLFFQKIKFTKKNYYLFICSHLAIFLFGSPDFRFLIGSILFFIFIKFFNYEIRQKYFITKLNKYSTVLLVLTFIFTLRVTTYVNYFENIFNVNVLQPPNIQTELRPDGFEKPTYGDQCWENLQCTNIKLDIVLKKSEKYGYKIFNISN